MDLASNAPLSRRLSVITGGKGENSRERGGNYTILYYLLIRERANIQRDEGNSLPVPWSPLFEGMTTSRLNKRPLLAILTLPWFD